jgi:hypothetical protein
MASGSGPGCSGRHPRGCCRCAGDPGFGGRSREVAARDGPRTSREPGAASSTTPCRYAAIGDVWFSCGYYNRITNSRRCHTGRYCCGNDGSPLGIQTLTSEETVSSTPKHTFGSAWSFADAIPNAHSHTMGVHRVSPFLWTFAPGRWRHPGALLCNEFMPNRFGIIGDHRIEPPPGNLFSHRDARGFASRCPGGVSMPQNLDLLRVRRLECFV